MNTLQTLVDASYATHNDERGHIKKSMYMGVEVMHNRCAKQKLNTKSSTEAEIFGASDYIPWTLWDKRFLEA